MSDLIASNVAANILTITPPGKGEVIRIGPDGKLFWHGREVETDADFRAAMLDLAEAFKATMPGLSGRFTPSPEATAWTRANHREESLERAIHALPGTQWTFWIELEGVTYKHEHVLPPFMAQDRSTPQKDDA